MRDRWDVNDKGGHDDVCLGGVDLRIERMSNGIVWLAAIRGNKQVMMNFVARDGRVIWGTSDNELFPEMANRGWDEEFDPDLDDED